MSEQRPLTVLCVTSYEKGQEFMRECKRQGCRVFLITVQSLEQANWPRESLDDIYFMPDKYQRDDIIKGAEELGVDLNEHIAFVIGAMEEEAAALGLQGTTG